MTSRRSAELEEIALRLRDRLKAEPDDPFLLAHVAGMWLVPMLGRETVMRGRTIVFDPSNKRSGDDVAQCVVRFLLQQEGFDDQGFAPAMLEQLAGMLIVYEELPQEPALAVG